MIITLKNQLCLLAFRACFIQKNFLLKMLILSKLLPPFWQKNPEIPESAIFWDFRLAAVQRRPSQTRTPKGVTKSCSTLF